VAGGAAIRRLLKQTGALNGNPVIGWIIGNTYEHYHEHSSWIENIVVQA
jgi:hypothetical protein